MALQELRHSELVLEFWHLDLEPQRIFNLKIRSSSSSLTTYKVPLTGAQQRRTIRCNNKKTDDNMLKTITVLKKCKSLKKCLEFLAETDAVWDQFNVRWQCVPGTWPGNGEGFVKAHLLRIMQKRKFLLCWQSGRYKRWQYQHRIMCDMLLNCLELS